MPIAFHASPVSYWPPTYERHGCPYAHPLSRARERFGNQWQPTPGLLRTPMPSRCACFCCFSRNGLIWLLWPCAPRFSPRAARPVQRNSGSVLMSLYSYIVLTILTSSCNPRPLLCLYFVLLFYLIGWRLLVGFSARSATGKTRSARASRRVMASLPHWSSSSGPTRLQTFTNHVLARQVPPA